MRISGINCYSSSIYRNDKNKYVNCSFGNEKMISAELIAKLKNNMTAIHERPGAYEVNIYETPPMIDRAGSYFFHMVNIPSNKLPELLGPIGEKYILSKLEGICLVLNDNKDDIVNSNIYENIICLFPSNSPNVSYSELLLKGVLD